MENEAIDEAIYYYGMNNNIKNSKGKREKEKGKTK